MLSTLAELKNLIGICYIKQGKGKEALPYLQAALTFHQGQKTPESLRMIGTSYNNIGSAFKADKKWDDAEKWLNKSLEYNREYQGDSASVLAFTCGHLCEVYSSLGKVTEALAMCNTSFDLSQEHNFSERECETLDLLIGINQTFPDQKEIVGF